MIVRQLEADDDRTSFDSGEQQTDRFFRTHALTNHQAGISRVYVAVDEPPSTSVLGFYALSATSVEWAAIRDVASLSLPRYPISALLIGQLAVHRAAQGRGIGTALLVHALGNCAALAERVAVFGVLVDALTDDLVRFYRRFGFETIPPQKRPRPLFLPMTTLQKAARGR